MDFRYPKLCNRIPFEATLDFLNRLINLHCKSE
jgi:hypothetical protein